MATCTHCGKALKDGENFCTGCGNKRASRVSGKRKTAPLSKKQKLTFLIGGAAIVLLVAGHFIVTQLLDPVTKIKAMDRAVTEEDAEGFLDKLEVKKDAWLKEEEYLRYIKTSDWETIRERLTGAVHAEQEFDRIVRDDYGNPFFIVKKKPFLFYDRFEFEAVPTTVHVTTELSDTSFEVENETYDFKDPVERETLASAYPGTYEIKGKADGDYGGWKETWVLDIFSGENGYDFYADFLYSTYGIDTNKPEAVLFVNGKSTKKTLAEVGEIGPVPEDAKLELHAEWKNADGRVEKSEVVRPGDVSFGALPFLFGMEEEDAFLEEEQAPVEAAAPGGGEEQAAEFVEAFRTAYEEALNTRDYSRIEPFLKEGSVAASDLKSFMAGLEEDGSSYEFLTNEVSAIDARDENTFFLTTRETFVFHGADGASVDYDRKKEYRLVLVDGTFAIEEITIRDTDRN
ncbi:zinc ribbon domain-containing protein [Halobacillus sp. BAB-2008]|uniref:TcaA NTF2-like domain-containing protein n=1 Tax=Halobacillus sp. BAB-2008 TaxID=1246484 RepID=UPI0002A509CF|nr:zinc ribbon domain-containing protein [Halobacillus sp. BAB-2008]ELK45861.1 hypothetical protein D479_13278 [Halobacillus sp. BAB-2008]